MNLENNIKEIFVVHSKDDEHIPYFEGKKFHSQIGGIFISLEGIPHKMNGKAIEMINNLAVKGKL